jgi:hypothetical protein
MPWDIHHSLTNDDQTSHSGKDIMLPQHEKACSALCGYTKEELRIKSVWIDNKTVRNICCNPGPEGGGHICECMIEWGIS